MKISDGLGDRIRHLRLQRGLTQAKLADPYSAAFVSQIERGARLPGRDALALFAKRLGVTIEELATGVAPSVEATALFQLHDGWRLLYLGDNDAARKAFRVARSAADQIDSSPLRGRALVGLARCAEYEGQAADASRLYGEALDLLRAGPVSAAAEAVAGLARCHQMRGDTRLALHVLERYLFELEHDHLSDPAALMRINASLVWPYSELGLLGKAAEAAERALQLQSRVDQPEEIASMHLNTARALLEMDRTDDALDSLKRAEEIFRDLNWRTEIARAKTNRGIVLTSLGKTTEALAEFQEALDTYRSAGFVRGEARTLNELARLERVLGKPARAQTLARQAVELLVEMRRFLNWRWPTGSSVFPAATTTPLRQKHTFAPSSSMRSVERSIAPQTPTGCSAIFSSAGSSKVAPRPIEPGSY